MRRQLADSYRLHPARRTSIPQHMQVLSCLLLACQDLRYCCNLRAIVLLSVLTLEGLPMKFLYLLRKSVHQVAPHLLHSGEDLHRLLFLMNLVIYPLTPLLLPWKLIVRCTTVVVIIHLENRLVDLLVKASYCSIPRHHDRLMTLEILHTRTIITILLLVHNRDQRHHLLTVAVLGLLRSKLTQVVNLLGLHNPARPPLSALLVCICHMSKTILPSKKVVGTDGLLQLITVIGGSVVQGMVVTTYPTLLSHILSTHHALHEHIALLHLLHLLPDHTLLVTGITSLL